MKKKKTALGQSVFRGEKRDPTTREKRTEKLGGTGRKYNYRGHEVNREEYESLKGSTSFSGGNKRPINEEEKKNVEKIKKELEIKDKEKRSVKDTTKEEIKQNDKKPQEKNQEEKFIDKAAEFQLSRFEGKGIINKQIQENILGIPTPSKEDINAFSKTTAGKIAAGAVTAADIGGLTTGLGIKGATIAEAKIEEETIGVITKNARLVLQSGEKGVKTAQWAFKSAKPIKPEILKIFNQVGRISLNSKTIALKSNYLIKLAKATSNPYVVLGILGSTLYTSLFWAPNEKGDALTLLSIAQGAAKKAGKYDKVKEIGDLIEEVYDISAGIPVIGFIKAEKAKFKAAKLASDSYKDN